MFDHVLDCLRFGPFRAVQPVTGSTVRSLEDDIPSSADNTSSLVDETLPLADDIFSSADNMSSSGEAISGGNSQFSSILSKSSHARK